MLYRYSCHLPMSFCRRLATMKTLKGIAHDIKGLVKSDKAPLRRPFDPEFDDLHRQYKDLRDWIEQVYAIFNLCAQSPTLHTY